MLKVIPPGAQVRVSMGESSILGTANSIRIDPQERVTYLVGWVSAGECSFEWFDAFAVEALGQVEPMKIGFGKADDARGRDGP